MIFGHNFLNIYFLRQAKILTFDRVPLFNSYLEEMKERKG